MHREARKRSDRCDRQAVHCQRRERAPQTRHGDRDEFHHAPHAAARPAHAEHGLCAPPGAQKLRGGVCAREAKPQPGDTHRRPDPRQRICAQPARARGRAARGRRAQEVRQARSVRPRMLLWAGAQPACAADRLALARLLPHEPL